MYKIKETYNIGTNICSRLKAAYDLNIAKPVMTAGLLVVLGIGGGCNLSQTTEKEKPKSQLEERIYHIHPIKFKKDEKPFLKNFKGFRH